MNEGPPRPVIDEILTRWTFTKLRLVVVEGASDQRLFRLIQREPHCHAALKDLDIWFVDAIDVPAELLERHGLAGGCWRAAAR